MILALDPGTWETGWVLYDGTKVHMAGVHRNEELLDWIRTDADLRLCEMAVEMIEARGMAVGRETFETCVWIGRFQQGWHTPEAVRKVYRRDVKMCLCGSARAKDSNIRAALIDLFPPEGGGSVRQVGTKLQPGPLYGVTSHAWQALAVAVTVAGAPEMATAAQA